MASLEVNAYFDAHLVVRRAKEWMSNSEKRDSQSGKPYTLAYFNIERVAYCGQAYAGAANYHDAPSEFRRALEVAAFKMSGALFAAALDILQEKERDALVACEGWLTEMQSRVAAAKGG